MYLDLPLTLSVRLTTKIQNSYIDINLKYDANVYYFLGYYLWNREPARTRFTWTPGTTYSQWIRGDFAD